MKHLKTLSQLLYKHSNDKEVYTSDQKNREKRKKKGYFTRSESTFDFIFLIKSWENIVGKLLASNSIPLRIRNRTLFISTKHQIFAQEMGFQSQTIIKKIHTEFPSLEGQVTKIKFINNEFTFEDFNKEETSFVKAKPVKQKLHPYSPEYKRRKFEALELFKDIEDDEVKEALTKYYLS